MSNIVNDKGHFGLEAVKYKDDVFSWIETMSEKEKKAKDALMKSDVMLVDKAGFLALCNLMLKMSKEISQLKADNISLVEQVNAMAMRMEHKSGTAQRSKS
ncbi:MAG: hypothetical protein EOM77_05005 [Bacteroidia bacterium]|nr:hypothetical protein [Bacteroidia bacterium]